jgi:hypothetical protein
VQPASRIAASLDCKAICFSFRCMRPRLSASCLLRPAFCVLLFRFADHPISRSPDSHQCHPCLSFALLRASVVGFVIFGCSAFQLLKSPSRIKNKLKMGLRRGIVSCNEVLRPCRITLSKLLPRSPSNPVKESLTVLHSGLPAQIVSWKKLPTAVIVSSPHTGSSLSLLPLAWKGERLCAFSILSLPPARSLNCVAGLRP